MDWVLREIDIKGEAGFLTELLSIIDKNNPAAKIWQRTGHITYILGDLHLNSKPYQDFRLYWTKAHINNKGHLIITEEAAPWVGTNFADILKRAFPDKIAGINYRFLYEF